MDNTNAVLADKLGEILAQLDEVVMTDTERAKVLIENYEALRQPTQTDAMREALEAAPIISQWEGPAEFRARQDEWLQGKYKAALEAPMVEITQDDKLLNEVVTLRWKCGDQAATIERLIAALEQPTPELHVAASQAYTKAIKDGYFHHDALQAALAAAAKHLKGEG